MKKIHQDYYDKVYERFNIFKKVKLLKNSAKARSFNIKLLLHEYALILEGGCFYCRSSLENQNGYCLDRLNSKDGYTMDNVIGCCKDCNYMKGTKSFNDFYSHVFKIYQHSKEHLENDRLHTIGTHGLHHPNMKKRLKEQGKFVQPVYITQPKILSK